MNNSYELLEALKNAGYSATKVDPLWWPESGTFWVIVGAILTQQTKWEKVEKSLANLRNAGISTLEALSNVSVDALAEWIKPSGFYNTKAKNLLALVKAIVKEYGSFDAFCDAVSREWLLAQKGVGEESADAILCYACLKEALVVDAYTSRLLEAFGYQFESYEALQEWMREGLERSKITALYGKEMNTNELYARFHGKIVEYCKENSSGKSVNVERLGV